MADEDPDAAAREALRQAIVAFRKTAGFPSRAHMARRLEAAESSLRDWENGKSLPKQAQLRRLKALGVEVPSLLLSASSTPLAAERPDREGRALFEDATPGATPSGPTDAPVRAASAGGNTLAALRRQALLGRLPLLIIGSGMSKGEVPLQPDITALLDWHLQRVPRDEPGVLQLLELCSSVSERLLDPTRQQSVTSTELAQVFTAASGAKTAGAREAWYSFSDDLLRKGNKEVIRDGKPRIPKGIYGATPTKGHRLLAKLLMQRKCLCVSINFDHLAWFALRQEGSPCVVLHDPGQISQYFTALTERDVPAVIHLRGDVLNVRCVERSCPQSKVPQVLSALIQRIRVSPETGEGSETLRCDACGAGRLAAEMSFPGEAAKERMGREALEALQTYVAGRLSALVFVGVSGRWDPHILRWAAEYSRAFDVPLVHVKQTASPSHIQQFLQVYYPGDSRLTVLVEDKDHFLEALTRALELPAATASTATAPLDGVSADELCRKDEIWYRDDPIFAPDGRTQVRSADFRSVYIHKSVYDYLDSFTQLSLVNTYLGLNDGHRRWAHCRGTAAVGTLWLKTLQSEIGRSRSISGLSQDRVELLVKHALLIHDCGHIPFSHLIERVLARIHWVAGGLDTIEADTLRDRLPRRGVGPGIPTGEVGLLETSEYVRDILAMPSEPRPALDDACQILLDLVRGRSAFAFANVICNSPIDADKIDYITRDSYELTRSPSGMRAAGALGARVQGGQPSYDWITDFLATQEVTRHGAIALHGRSAVAAAELWRQRVWTYQRVYFAPEIRVLERGVAEILEQFAIRYVIAGHGDWTAEHVSADPRPGRGDAVDLRKWKADTVRRVLEYLAKVNRDTDRERHILEHVHRCLTDSSLGQVVYDSAYKDFLEAVWQMVRRWLPPAKPSWPSGTLEHLVGHPLYARVPEEVLVDRLRPLQHHFGHTVLIDVVRGAKALSGPATHRFRNGEAVFGNVLVPTGHCRTWTGKSEATKVLTSKVVEDVEDMRCQILVISPHVPAPPAALHAYEAVRDVIDQLAMSEGGTS